MKFQIASINNGELRHYYEKNGMCRMSKNRATNMSHEKASQIVQGISNSFIVPEYDCHFQN